MAEGARLESVFTRKGNVGSNPTLSASFSHSTRRHELFDNPFRASCISCGRIWRELGESLRRCQSRICELDGGGIGVWLPLRKSQIEEHKQQHRSAAHQHAAFGADGASGKPVGSGKGGMQEVSLGGEAAIRCAVEETLSPIPGSVKAYREPQGAGSPQGENRRKAR